MSHYGSGVEWASNRNEYQEYFLVGKGGLHVPIVLKSGNLNLLEPSGPVQACTGISLPKITIKAMNPSHHNSFSDLKSSDSSKICSFSFSSYSMALLPIFGPWHPCCRDFETIEFILGEDISLTSNPQTCWSGYLFVSGTSLNTSQAWVAPPKARLPQALVPTNSHTPIDLNVSVIRFNVITLLLADIKNRGISVSSQNNEWRFS